MGTLVEDYGVDPIGVRQVLTGLNRSRSACAGMEGEGHAALALSPAGAVEPPISIASASFASTALLKRNP